MSETSALDAEFRGSGVALSSGAASINERLNRNQNRLQALAPGLNLPAEQLDHNFYGDTNLVAPMLDFNNNCVEQSSVENFLGEMTAAELPPDDEIEEARDLRDAMATQTDDGASENALSFSSSTLYVVYLPFDGLAVQFHWNELSVHYGSDYVFSGSDAQLRVLLILPASLLDGSHLLVEFLYGNFHDSFQY